MLNNAKKIMVLLIFTILFFSLSQAADIYADPTQFTPETLTLTPGATVNDINLTWYSDKTANSVSKVRFIEQSNGQVAKEITGAVSNASKGKLTHKVSVTGLKQNTQYIYSVSNDGKTWSMQYPYKTAAGSGFRFAYVGDPQLTVGEQDKTSKLFSSDKSTRQGWMDTVAKIAAAKVDFIAGVGDQVDKTAKGDEKEYANFFAPQELKSVPFAPAIGNHDRHYLFLYHFNLPNERAFEAIVNDTNKNNVETGTLEAAANYWYTYNNALFVVLNTSAYPDSATAAKPYIDRFDATISYAINANRGKYTWLFVQHHKSTTSVAQHVADTDIQYYVEAGFEKLMDKYNVDFVLAGHDHVYARSYVMNDGKAVNTVKDVIINPTGTIYLTATTASGLKYYNIFDAKGIYVKDNQDYPYLVNGLKGSAKYLEKNLPLSTNVYAQNKKPEYTLTDVGTDTVTFSTFDIDSNSPIDTFTVRKLKQHP